MQSEIESQQGELRQLNEDTENSASLRAEKQKMEEYLGALNNQVADKRRHQERARQELKEVQAAITELREQLSISESLQHTVSEDLARAQSALAQEKQRHSQSLNSELKKAREAIHERDVIITRLQNQLAGRNGMSAAERAIEESNAIIGGVTASQDWPSGGNSNAYNNNTETLDEQMTGSSVFSGPVSGPYVPALRRLSAPGPDTEDFSETGSMTDYSAMDTPRDAAPPPA